MTVACPLEACDRQFSTENGCVMHVLNKQDETHSGYTSKPEIYALLPETDNQDPADESGDKSEGIGIPDNHDSGGSEPDGESGDSGVCPDCGGEMQQLEPGQTFAGEVDGTEVRAVTNRGDMFCAECDLVSGAGGEVVR